VPLKPAALAELKSNNYLLNALCMLAAKERGGTYGIGVDGAGNVLESCVLNVAIVDGHSVLRTPPFRRVLRGTTVRRAMELASEHLVPRGELAGVVQAFGWCLLPLVTASLHPPLCTRVSATASYDSVC